MERIEVRLYRESDLPDMVRIWNEVVCDGIAYPQEAGLTEASGREFFAQQSAAAVAVQGGEVLGLYILHPNNVGRCGHIANASYAVAGSARGKHIGEKLVLDSVARLSSCGFRGLQFNAVVATNVHARHLYERCGFRLVGTIPGGFRMDDRYEDICIYYIDAK